VAAIEVQERLQVVNEASRTSEGNKQSLWRAKEVWHGG